MALIKENRLNSMKNDFNENDDSNDFNVKEGNNVLEIIK